MHEFMTTQGNQKAEKALKSAHQSGQQLAVIFEDLETIVTGTGASGQIKVNLFSAFNLCKDDVSQTITKILKASLPDNSGSEKNSQFLLKKLDLIFDQKQE